MNGRDLRDMILKLLNTHHVSHNHLVHEETPTSEDSARIRGTLMSEGVKSIIVRGKRSGTHYQFNFPSSHRLNMKAVARIVGEKCEFEKPDVILSRYDLAIGGIPPFGNLLGIQNYMDDSVLNQPRAAFNCGLRTESLVMSSSDLMRITSPVIDTFITSE